MNRIRKRKVCGRLQYCHTVEFTVNGDTYHGELSWYEGDEDNFNIAFRSVPGCLLRNLVPIALRDWWGSMLRLGVVGDVYIEDRYDEEKKACLPIGDLSPTLFDAIVAD